MNIQIFTTDRIKKFQLHSNTYAYTYIDRQHESAKQGI